MTVVWGVSDARWPRRGNGVSHYVYPLRRHQVLRHWESLNVGLLLAEASPWVGGIVSAIVGDVAPHADRLFEGDGTPDRLTDTGEPPPFEEIYRANAARVYRFCLAQLRNPADAEDIAGEVFINAMTAYERTRPSAEHVVPWLFRIARNSVIDHHRRTKSRWRMFDRVSADRIEDPDVEGIAEIRSELRVVLAAMEKLNRRDRTLVGMRLASGLPFSQIAATLQISEHAATIATYRAIQRLRRAYEAMP